jgi:hypothetical protein
MLLKRIKKILNYYFGDHKNKIEDNDSIIQGIAKSRISYGQFVFLKEREDGKLDIVPMKQNDNVIIGIATSKIRYGDKVSVREKEDGELEITPIRKKELNGI